METLKILLIDDTCTGCGACAAVCPKSCIAIEQNREGFYYPYVDSSKCIDCRLCEKACHVINPFSNDSVPEDGFVVYKCSNDKIREESTSGGAFSLLAESVLREDGVVFGSCFNSKDNRLEVMDSDHCDWRLFRKSKYVETFTGKTFIDVIRFLREGRHVLYCSTPCQIRGLKQLLKVKKIDDSRLITVDLICHGVPSIAYFNYFLKHYKLDSKEIYELNFRYKNFSDPDHLWHSQAISVTYKDGTRKILPDRPPYSYYFFDAFNVNISLRKSCYTCNYPKYSYADFTIADFWGVADYNPELDDNKGISLVKLNTDKAKEFWSSIKKIEVQKSVEYKYGKYVYEKMDKRPLRDERDIFYAIAGDKGFQRATMVFYWKKLLKYYTKSIIKIVIGKK